MITVCKFRSGRGRCDVFVKAILIASSVEYLRGPRIDSLENRPRFWENLRGGLKKVDKAKVDKNQKFHQKSLFCAKSVTIAPFEVNSSKETVTNTCTSILWCKTIRSL